MERIPCSPSPECKYYASGRCREDTDHWFYPRTDYTSSIERKFRELPENKREICRVLHEERHATEPPPPKPSYEVMAEAVATSGVYLNVRLHRALEGL